MRAVNGSLGAEVARFLQARGHLVLLALLVSLALFLRLYGINWDQGGLYHPDERAILFHVEALSFPINDLSSLFSSSSSLNPAWFAYGSLPLYLLKLTGFLAPPFLEDPGLDKLAIMGRATSSIFDIVTILSIYVVGARLFGKWAGLLGASFIALSALHIQQSHFLVTDIMLASWLMVSFYFLTQAMEKATVRGYALAGLFFGLALATKVSAAPFALTFVAAAALYALGRQKAEPSQGVRLQQALGGLMLAGGVTILAFLIAQPYAFIDPRTFLGDVGEQSEMVRRIRDYPFTRQYIDTTPYVYHVRQLAVWGMGLPLGILLWTGMAFSLGAALLRRRRKHILLLSWVLPYFLITGSFEVKFMRYLLPISPFLAIMAASMVTWVVGKLRQSPRRVLKPRLVYAGLGVVMAFTVFYALAYVNIYSRPHTAEAASDWINANVPPGAVLLQDSGWEEGFKRLGGYNQFRMEVYDEETRAKRQRMIKSLAQADYLLFYSNRQYGTIPRLPERYPMTREYYRLLFSGELGYELVHWETSYPELYGLSFADNTFGRPDLPTPGPLLAYEQTSISLNMGFADESFTVYDHPAVLIFKNTLPATAAERQAFLDASLPQPGQPRARFDTRLLLSAEDARAQQEGGTWSRVFDRDSIFNKIPAVSWFVLVQVVFLLTLPITLVLFRWLPDRGYLLGKMLGILLVAYVPWLLASLHWLSFSRVSIALGMVTVAVASAGILRFKHREILDFLRENKRLIVVGEALFLLSFLALYGIRLWNPDLWHPFRGGEKPMDFAYFNAVVRSTYMPPYDPWFSGGYLNYYYFGYFMNATLTKFTGIPPAVAINMVVPLFFALTTAAAFSIVYNLTTLMRRRIREASGAAARVMPSPIWAGLIAAAFVAVIGNLDGVVQVSQGIGRVLTGGHFGAFDFWRSSRMMPPDPPGFEITEFPFFTFLFADPHAHLFVIPLTLLALGLALAIILGAQTRYPLLGRMAVLPFLALGLTLGAILATNSWDALTYAVVGALALLIAEFSLPRRFDFPFVASSLAKIGALGALAALFFLPYLSNYRVPIRDGADSFVSPVPLLGGIADTFDATFKSSETVTVLYQYMGIHGIFIVILFSFLALELWRHYRSSFSAPEAPLTLGFHMEGGFRAAVQTLGWRWLAYIGISTVGIALLAATGYATVGFISGLLLLLAPLVLRELLVWDQAMPLRLFVYALIALPLLLGVLVDLFTFEGDIARLNTVFKFYLQAWVLFALASAYALWRLRFGEAIPWKRVRRGWQGLVLLLVAASLIYPVMATPVRARDRFDTLPPSTNGMTFMDAAVYSDKGAQMELRWDRQGIEWLQDNVQGSPVIVEGITPLYRWGGRISVYTGLPAVIGWDHHQRQQRGDYAGRNSGVDRRRREVGAFFSSRDTTEARAFLDRYNVRYIYVGQMERVYYPVAGLAKFDTMLGDTLHLAYENPQVRIYRVAQGL